MFLSFLFVSHHNLYYCGSKKLNSISDSLLCFFFSHLSLPQTIYKGTTWQPMKLVCSDFALSPLPFSWLPNIFFTFLISLFLMAVPSGIFFFFFVLLFLVISVVEKEWVRMQTEKLKFFVLFFWFLSLTMWMPAFQPSGSRSCLKDPLFRGSPSMWKVSSLAAGTLLASQFWPWIYSSLKAHCTVDGFCRITKPRNSEIQNNEFYVAYMYRETTRYTEM